ncbi:MAG TPA: signal peptidase II, partial [Thermoanaerobaculia bacterium]
MLTHKTKLFLSLVCLLVLTDCTTKQLAVLHLPPDEPQEMIGSALRFTLVYNPGAAMSLSFGPSSRWAFTALALLALTVLGHLYRHTQVGDLRQAAALALVCGGAIGNLVDRLRSPLGVVDFIDVGVGNHRFWTFNVADMAITLGVVLLGVL